MKSIPRFNQPISFFTNHYKRDYYTNNIINNPYNLHTLWRVKWTYTGSNTPLNRGLVNRLHRWKTMRTPGGEANAKVIKPHHDNPQEDPKKRFILGGKDPLI